MPVSSSLFHWCTSRDLRSSAVNFCPTLPQALPLQQFPLHPPAMPENRKPLRPGSYTSRSALVSSFRLCSPASRPTHTKFLRPTADFLSGPPCPPSIPAGLIPTPDCAALLHHFPLPRESFPKAKIPLLPTTPIRVSSRIPRC